MSTASLDLELNHLPAKISFVQLVLLFPLVFPPTRPPKRWSAFERVRDGRGSRWESVFWTGPCWPKDLPGPRPWPAWILEISGKPSELAGSSVFFTGPAGKGLEAVEHRVFVGTFDGCGRGEFDLQGSQISNRISLNRTCMHARRLASVSFLASSDPAVLRPGWKLASQSTFRQGNSSATQQSSHHPYP